jgi:hypothetical protein
MSGPDRADPMAEGRRAAASQGETMSNPYPKGTEEHAKWLEGYESALVAEDDGTPSDFA